MKHILSITILFFLSFNLYGHDFIWGERIERLIEKNGSPDLYEDYLNNGSLINLTYNLPAYIRTYTFTNRQLVGVMDVYGPFNERQLDNAFDIAMMLSDIFLNKYTYEKEINYGFQFKYGNDIILLQILSDERMRNLVTVVVFYRSPFI